MEVYSHREHLGVSRQEEACPLEERHRGLLQGACLAKVELWAADYPAVRQDTFLGGMVCLLEGRCLGTRQDSWQEGVVYQVEEHLLGARQGTLPGGVVCLLKGSRLGARQGILQEAVA